MARREDFNPDVPLPPGLEVGAIRRAIDYMERELAELVEVYYEQANVFSALVGIFGTRALDSFSNYEKHRTLTRRNSAFLICAGAAPDLIPVIVSKAKEANARGPYNPITTMRAGISFGVTSWTRPNRSNGKSR